jgi:FHS family glucose/mannose:H+ symporter-like MFS transporter
MAFGRSAIGLEASLIGLGPTALIRAGVAEPAAAELLSALLRGVPSGTGGAGLRRPPDCAVPAVYAGGPSAAAISRSGRSSCRLAVFFVAMGASAGLFFPGFYVTASGKMGEDIRVPPTIIASGLVGGIGAPLVLAPLMAGMGERGFFWIVAGVTLALTLAAVLSLRRMRV